MKVLTMFRNSIAVLVLLTVILSTSSLSVSAEESLEDVPQTNYTYWIFENEKTAVVDRAVFTYEKNLDGKVLNGSGVSDICHDADGRLYVLDGENGKVVVLSPQHQIEKIIDGFLWNGETLTLNAPEGLFVDSSRMLYIADTQNSRVLQCDINGVVQKVITTPSGEILPSDLTFTPIKVIKNSKGYLYVLLRGSYYGALTFDESGEFLGFFGSNKVQNSPIEAFARIWNRIFPNNEGAVYQTKKLPYQFLDLCLDSQDFLYTVSPNADSAMGQIRKLSPTSANILTYSGGNYSTNGDSIDFGDPDVYENILGAPISQTFNSIAVDESGYIYALDSNYGRVFVYDAECNPITVFGGGMNLGSQKGNFTAATAIDVFNGHVYVADSAKKSVTVFTLTPYGKLLMEAQSITLTGEYLQAEPLWREISTLSSNCQLAYRGLAKAALTRGDNQSAMRYARLGQDKSVYNLAFQKVSNAFVSDNIFWILAVILILTAGVVFLMIYTSKRQVVLIKNRYLRTCFHTIIHPFNAFYDVKHRKAGSITLAIILTLLYFVVHTLQNTCVGFMYSSPTEFNALYAFFGSVGLILLWSIVNWAVSTLFEGKGKWKDIFIVTSYSLLPLLFSKLFILVATQFVVPNTSVSIITIVNTVCTFAFGVILIIGLMQIHDFGFIKTIVVSLITLLGLSLIHI